MFFLVVISVKHMWIMIIRLVIVWLALFLVEEKLLVGLHLGIPWHLSLLGLHLGGSHSMTKLKHSIVEHITGHWLMPVLDIVYI